MSNIVLFSPTQTHHRPAVDVPSRPLAKIYKDQKKKKSVAGFLEVRVPFPDKQYVLYIYIYSLYIWLSKANIKSQNKRENKRCNRFETNKKKTLVFPHI